MISLRARARPPLWHLPPRPRRPLRRNAHTSTGTSPIPSSKEPKTHYARGEAISVNTLIASFATLLVGMAGGGVGAAVWVDSKVGSLASNTNREIAELKVHVAALSAKVDMLVARDWEERRRV